MSECQASTSVQHQCDTCHKTFSKECYLRRHRRLVHVEDQRATCQFCNKQICKPNLKRHEDLVHREIKKLTRVMIAKLNMVQKSSLTATSVKNIICPNFIVITVTNHSHISATYDSKTKFVRVTPRASLDWIYKSVCYRTGMLPFDPLRGPVCNAAASSIL